MVPVRPHADRHCRLFKSEGRWYLLRASIPVGGWTITLLNQLYLLAEQSTPLCKCLVAGRRTSAQSKRIHRVVATSAKPGAGTALHGHLRRLD